MNKSSGANSVSIVSDVNGASTTVPNYSILPAQLKPKTIENSKGSTSPKREHLNDEQHMYVLDPDVAELLAEGLSVKYICDRLKKVCADRFDKNVVYAQESGVIDAQFRVKARTLLGEVSYGGGANGAPTPGNTSQTNETINARRRKAKKIVTSLGVMKPSYYLRQKEWLGDITYTCKECHAIFSKDVHYLYLLHLLGHLQFLVSIEELGDNYRHLLQRIMKDGNIVKYLELHGLEMHLFHEFNEGRNCAVVSNPVTKEKNNLTSCLVAESVNVVDETDYRVKEKDSLKECEIKTNVYKIRAPASVCLPPSKIRRVDETLNTTKYSNKSNSTNVDNNSIDLHMLNGHIAEQDVLNEFESKYFGKKSHTPVPEAIQFLKYVKEQDKPFQCITCNTSFRLLRTFVMHMGQMHNKYITADQVDSLEKELSKKPTSSFKGKKDNTVKRSESECLQTIETNMSKSVQSKSTNNSKDTAVKSTKNTDSECSQKSKEEKACTSAEALRYLKYNKIEDKPFQCIKCNTDFRLLMTFVSHMGQFHNKFIPVHQLSSLEIDMLVLSNKHSDHLKGSDGNRIKNTGLDLDQSSNEALSDKPAYQSTDNHGIKNTESECLKIFKRENSPTNGLKGTDSNDFEGPESECFQISNEAQSYTPEVLHYLNYQKMEKKPFHCIPCNTSFRLLRIFVKHMGQVHKKFIPADQVYSLQINLLALSNKHDLKSTEGNLVKSTELDLEHTSNGVPSDKSANNLKTTKDNENTESENFQTSKPSPSNKSTNNSTNDDGIRITDSEYKPLRCFKCKKEFINNFFLNAHIKFKHPVSNKCNVCPKRCATDYNLKQLVHTLKEINCENCKRKFVSDENLKLHMETDSIETVSIQLFSCTQCTQQFTGQTDLDIHVADMHNTVDKVKDWLLSCPHCDKKFKTKSVGKKHIRDVHAKNICPTCGKMYKGRRNLYYHRRHEHNEGRGLNKDYERSVQEEKYKCEFCSRCFGRDFILRNHNSRHVCEDGRFQCLICWYTFEEKEKLMAHMTSEHSDNREVKAKCHICQRSFITRKSLRIHITIVHSKNESVRCSQCQKEFSSNIVLKSHINLRHPFSVKCNVCHKICATVLHLKRHKLLHTQRNKFRCIHCKMKFISEENLKKHLETHANETASVKLLNCPHCVKQFLEKPALAMHVTEVHNVIKDEDAPFSCTNCEFKFRDKSALDTHVTEVHNLIQDEDAPFSCTYCDYKFEDKSTLQTHVTEVHSMIKDEDAQFSCTYCDYKFEDKSTLETHVTEVHSMIKDEDGMLSCTYCDQKFKTEFSRNRHVRALHAKKCPTCGKLFSDRQNLYYHIRHVHNAGRCLNADYESAMKEGKYKCQFCLKCFGNDVMLKIHEKKQLCKDGSFKCSTCGKLYSNQANLYCHIRHVHNAGRCLNTDYERVVEAGKYKCQFCLRCFGRYFILENHEKKHLCEDGRFKCLVCGFTFAEKEHVVAHVTTEHSDIINLNSFEYKKLMLKRRKQSTNKDPCQCDHCGMVLTNSQFLIKHIQSFHPSDNTTEEESSCFTCKECGKSYATNHRLKKHIYHIHTPKNFCVCHICGKELTCKEILTKHMVMHDEPQHECGICKKKFRRSYYLKAHQQMHSSVKQFFCPICSKQCAFATGLNYHMKTHHKTIKE